VEWGILTVPSLIIKHDYTQIKRNVDLFSEKKGIHSKYNLRDKKNTHTGNPMQSLHIDLYNSSPVHINDLFYKEFKIYFNKFLIKNAFDSIDEYK